VKAIQQLSRHPKLAQIYALLLQGADPSDIAESLSADAPIVTVGQVVMVKQLIEESAPYRSAGLVHIDETGNVDIRAEYKELIGLVRGNIHVAFLTEMLTGRSPHDMIGLIRLCDKLLMSCHTVQTSLRDDRDRGNSASPATEQPKQRTLKSLLGSC